MSIPASVPAPVGPGGFQSKGRARAAANNKKYGTPLPILSPESPLYAAALASPLPNSTVIRLGLFTSARAIVPTVIGVLDRDTQSVFVSDPDDMRLLFERGFFGKGSLSRSEPSWRDGRRELSKGGNAANAEKIREQRRKERKQFKIDRAAAMKEAAIKAEAVVAAKKAAGETPRPGTPKLDTPTEEKDEEGGDGEKEGKEVKEGQEAEGDDLDVNALTPQTFLVRPTRPDANRNRGKKAFRRKPNAPTTPGGAGPSSSGTPGTATPAKAAEVAAAEQAGPTEGESAAQAAEKEAEAQRRAEERAKDAASTETVAELVDEREHSQSSYPEASFSASIGVLKIHDPEENAMVPSGREVTALLTPLPGVPGTINTEILPDDPSSVQYAVYAHFRALGWCVRSGIKFCVDWLLYRRGPVFSHSAFSILVVPVYMNNSDRDASPHACTDWYAERQSWKWINTVMRVNSLVMKTVVVAYVTIPSRETFRTYGGDLSRIMGQFSVREVSLMRFSPARRRD